MAETYRTMQEIVYDAIRDAILSGHYLPGQRLVADELARELGVSRMPVREALQRLQVAGLIAITRHKGAVVSELMENLYDASQRLRNISVLIPGRLDQITQEHRLIAEALARGDAPVAEQHANEHHEGTARRLLNSLGAEREHAAR